MAIIFLRPNQSPKPEGKNSKGEPTVGSLGFSPVHPHPTCLLPASIHLASSLRAFPGGRVVPAAGQDVLLVLLRGCREDALSSWRRGRRQASVGAQLPAPRRHLGRSESCASVSSSGRPFSGEKGLVHISDQQPGRSHSRCPEMRAYWCFDNSR